MSTFFTIEEIKSEIINIEEMKKENETLKQVIQRLETELTNSKKNIKQLKEIIDERNNDMALEILEYFNRCNSIRKTARKYDMDMEELYEIIPEWDGCRDGLQGADDYDECRIDVIGRKQYDEECDEYTDDELADRKRTPEKAELDEIIADYKEDRMTLYEIADHYNLWINNLFRLLKENKLIEKETDVNNYPNFYMDYEGIGSEWDGKSDLGLIETFYTSSVNN